MSDETTRQASTPRDQGRSEKRPFLVLYSDDRSRLLEFPEGGVLLVGRDPECEVRLEDTKVSRRHARLYLEDGLLFVEDLGSKNRTRVNGVPIDGSLRLGNGDEVGVGSASLVVSSLCLSLGEHRILDYGELEERLEAEADRARRFRRPVGLALVRLSSRAGALREQLVTVARHLRKMDTLASWGTRDFALLLPELEAGGVASLVGRLAGALGGEVRFGTASYPEEVKDPMDLLEAASARLLGRGRPMTQSTPPPPRGGQMGRVLELARRIAEFTTTVLITGETGSGKQIVAEAIHRASPRREGPFVHVNCAALPTSLVESELFGHERGAFTGADQRKPGTVEAAERGTLFLDEIGELGLEAQPKLLRFLQDRTFSRVGATGTRTADVRILAATNRRLEEEAKAGRFREDLLFRLSAIVLEVPPLRDRPEEIEPLARQFTSEIAKALGKPVPGISDSALAALRRCRFPGNVRQLRNAIERAVVLSDGGTLEVCHLPERMTAGQDQAAALPETAGRLDGLPLEEALSRVEAAIIRTALEECGGNQSAAARRLGITRRAFIYRMEKLGIR
jgi:two-component system, NtrC family, response regulator AtoC